jgi:hypothetical protein
MARTDSGHRHALRVLAAGGVAAVALTVVTATAGPGQAKAWDFPAERIAEQARTHAEGSYGGQCKVFAQNVVNEVLKSEGIKARITGYGARGGAYFGTYQHAGGELVDPEAGQPGDLIQVITAAKRNSDFPPTRNAKGDSILHTAIIVERTEKPGRYIVHDSNYVAGETVGEHAWTPSSWRKHGVEVYVWRFGSVPPGSPGEPIQASGAVEMPALGAVGFEGHLDPIVTATGGLRDVYWHALP